MKYTCSTAKITDKRRDCLVLGVYQSDKNLPPATRSADALTGGLIRRRLQSAGGTLRQGQSLLLFDVPQLRADQVLLIGCGAADKMDRLAYIRTATAAAAALINLPVQTVTNTLPLLTVPAADMRWKVRQTVLASEESLYRFDDYRSLSDSSDKGDKRHLIEMTLSVSGANRRAINKGLREGEALAAGVTLTKNLANTPPNVCTPDYLAKQAKILSTADSKRFRLRVLSEAEMRRLGMNSLLAVSSGSRQPPHLITLEYRGAAEGKAPVVLVGKGVTFDTGGISLKPAASMDEMKFDMCGAASVLGVLKTISVLRLPINVVGVIPTVENMPGSNASRPGDIVKTLSGQTVEILNTDAEGRLILCDALTYCERFKPKVVIDMATLTGACVVALGKQASGLLGNDDGLIRSLLKAGNLSGDRAWPLPLWPEYDQQLKSTFADMGNIGGRDAGTITAACFLARFTKKFVWAHLDIAGTAWHSGRVSAKATGRPVPLLVQYLLDS